MIYYLIRQTHHLNIYACVYVNQYNKKNSIKAYLDETE